MTNAFALLIPLALFALLNHGASGSWWAYDDPCLLRSVVERGVAAHFVDPATWRGVSGTLLMPWTIFSFGIDYHAFGLEPLGFYAHHLLSFAVLIVVACVVLRRFLTPAFACLALSLFVVSLPSFVVAQRLMNRSYVEGLALALASLALYHHSLVARRVSWAIAGALFYGAATTAKEVFVPLVVILPFLPGARVAARLRHSIPYVVVAVAYVAWRTWILLPGQTLTSYGERAGTIASVAELALPLGLVEPWQWLGTAVLLGLALVVLARRAGLPRSFLLAAALALTVPLLFLGSMLTSRHYFVLSFAACSAIAAALQWTCLPAWRGAWSMVPVTLGVALVSLTWKTTVDAEPWRSHRQAMRQYRAEGSFLFRDAEHEILMTDLENTSYLSCMRDLASVRGFVPPGFCGDPCFCAKAFPDATLWADDGTAVVRIAGSASADCASEERIDTDFTYDSSRGMIRWRFGPHSDGAYAVLLVFDADAPAISIPVPVARQGAFPLWLNEPLRLVAKHQSTTGSLAYSPVHTLTP
jgi:hypothetical protein